MRLKFQKALERQNTVVYREVYRKEKPFVIGSLTVQKSAVRTPEGVVESFEVDIRALRDNKAKWSSVAEGDTAGPADGARDPAGGGHDAGDAAGPAGPDGAVGVVAIAEQAIDESLPLLKRLATEPNIEEHLPTLKRLIDLSTAASDVLEGEVGNA